jgi:hypothetical protein
MYANFLSSFTRKCIAFVAGSGQNFQPTKVADHLKAVVTLMSAADAWPEFMKLINKLSLATNLCRYLSKRRNPSRDELAALLFKAATKSATHY